MGEHLDGSAARLWLEGLPPCERELVEHLLTCPNCARAAVTGTGPSEPALPPGAAALDYADDAFRPVHVPQERAVRAALAAARELADGLEQQPLETWIGVVQSDETYQTLAFVLAAIDRGASRWSREPIRAAEWARLAIEAATLAEKRGESAPLLLAELARAWGLLGYARAVGKSQGTGETAFAAASTFLRDGRGLGGAAEAFVCRLQAHAYAARGRLSEALAFSGRAYALYASHNDVEEACAELLYFASLAARADLLEQAVDALNRVRLLCGGGGRDERIARRRLAWLLGVLLRRPEEAAEVLREPILPGELAHEATQELSFLAVLDALEDRPDVAERRLWQALEAAKSQRDIGTVTIVCLHLAALALTSGREPLSRLTDELAWCEQHGAELAELSAEAPAALERLRRRIERGQATLGDVLDAADVLSDEEQAAN